MESLSAQSRDIKSQKLLRDLKGKFKASYLVFSGVLEWSHDSKCLDVPYGDSWRQ